MRLRTRLVDPNCGWARFSVSPVARAPGFFFDLGQQTLRFVPESGPARSAQSSTPLAKVLQRVDDTFWLPRVEDSSWRRAALRELRSRRIPRLLEAEAGVAVQPADDEVVVSVPAHELLVGAETPGAVPGAAVVAPWVPGFTARADAWTTLLDEAIGARASALVLIRPEIDDSAKRELASRCEDDRQYSELFHVESARDEAALRAARAAVRAAGLSTVIERPLPAGPERLRRNRRVAAALLTVAESSDGFSVARREEYSRAARWIENEQRDLLAIADDGNLKVLDWLPDEAHGLVRSVLEAGEEFRLAALDWE